MSNHVSMVLSSLYHFRYMALSYILCVSCAQLPDPQADAPSPAVVSDSALEGRWRMVDERLDQAGITLIWVFEKERAIVMDGEGQLISDSAYEIDASKSPAHITVFIQDAGGEEERLGIYRVEDNLLLLTWSLEAGVRPTEFDTDLGSRFERMYD